ncbi:MAG: PRC-barrel domain-containing protein [Cyclobacteriaceae bacterium]
MNDQLRSPILSASTIKRTTVKNPKDEKIGNIEDIMMDSRTGKVAYVVLSVDTGFLNLGSKYFALPWQSFAFETHQDDVVILNVDKEKLENSPGFDKDNWPSGPQTEFIGKINTYYGIKTDRYEEDRVGTMHNDTQRDNYENRRDPGSKESEFIG